MTACVIETIGIVGIITIAALNSKTVTVVNQKVETGRGIESETRIDLVADQTQYSVEGTITLEGLLIETTGDRSLVLDRQMRSRLGEVGHAKDLTIEIAIAIGVKTGAVHV